MSRYASLSDDYYVNMNLNTEMELPKSRESVLHLFEQVRKRYPMMRNLYSRDRDEYVLEEDKDRGSYRWATVEPRRICSGSVNPASPDEAIEQHALVLEMAPFAMSASPLDCESLNVMYGFDFTYRGNHNQLLVEALGVSPSLERFLEVPGNRVISSEPALQLALDEDCRVQCRISFETRTTAYHVRTGEFPEEQLSVYLTTRRYGSLDVSESLTEVMHYLAEKGAQMVDDYLIDGVLGPLQKAISLR